MHPTLNIGTSYSIKKVQYRKIVLFFTSRDVKKRHYRLYPIISDTNISIALLNMIINNDSFDKSNSGSRY